MKKPAILIGAALVLALLVFYLVPLDQEKPAAAPATVATPSQVVVHNDLPNMQLLHLDGSRGMAKDIRGKAVLILFQPDCDHCQRETVQIREHLNAFQGYKLYFISDAPPQQLSQFAREYGLAGNPDIHFAHTSIENILNSYGPIDAPSVYIYTAEGRLKKSFIGETPIENILQHM
jgi:peroxiredoxin